MKKVLLTFIFLLCSVAVSAAERIISLKPNITEIIYALQAEDKLVGVTTYCNRPLEAKQLPQVADYLAPSVEKVVALQPDLLLTSEENGQAAPVLRLQELGYKVDYFQFDTIAQTLHSIEAIGHDLQQEQLATQLTKQIEKKLIHLQSNSPRHKPQVLLLLGTQPLVAAGKNTLLSELLEVAGGENVLQNNHAPWPRLNEEELLKLQPEIIFSLEMGQVDNGKLWKKFPQIPAVQNHAVYLLNSDDFRAGPNLANAAAALQKFIYASTHK